MRNRNSTLGGHTQGLVCTQDLGKNDSNLIDTRPDLSASIGGSPVQVAEGCGSLWG